MKTDASRHHARYDELTAGYAVDALDPEDLADFEGHLAGCARCQDAVARFTELTAALAQTAPPAEPSPDLGRRIMAAVAREPVPAGQPGPAGESAFADHSDADADADREPGRAGPPAERPSPAGLPPVRRLRGAPRPAAQHRTARPRRPLRVAAAGVAAAAALIAGGATYAGLQGGGTPQPPAAGCVQARTCREIVLTGASSRAPAARLIVANGTAWLVPSGLKADNTAQQVYVLWQITGGHTPLAVGSFDVRGHSVNHPIRVGALTVPYSGTWAFAVSLEHGRTIPASPSHPVALGQVPA
jgi:anti-sigma-K factor RskA